MGGKLGSKERGREGEEIEGRWRSWREGIPSLIKFRETTIY